MFKIKNYSKLLILGLCLFLLLSVTYVGNVQAAKYTLKYAHSNAADPYQSIEQMWGVVFKGIVESKTDGDVKVDIYPAGQLGGQRKIIESVQMGTIEIGGVADAVISNFDKTTSILSMPFLFKNIDDSYKLWQSDWGKEWSKEFIDKTGMRIIGIGGYGFRCLTNNVRVIKTPDDAKGLKFRVMESPVPVAMIRGLGASAQPISASELYSALEQGVVDGQENPLTSIVSYKYYEVQKYLTLDRHQLGNELTVINEDVFQSLPAKYQKIIVEAGKEACFAQMGTSTITNKGTGMKLVNEKMNVYSPTPEQLEMFKKAMQPPAKKVIEEEVGKEKVEEAMKAIQKIETEKDLFFN